MGLQRLMALGTLSASLMLAQGAYVGVEADIQGSKKSIDFDDNTSDKNTITQPALGIKLGWDFDTYRTYIGYSYNLKGNKEGVDDYGTLLKNTFSSHDFVAGADYTPKIAENWKGLLGAFVGYSKISMKQDWQISNGLSGQYSIDLGGYNIGAKVGAIYVFDNHNEIEMGVKVDYADYGDEPKFGITDIKGTSYGIFVGHNYKF